MSTEPQVVPPPLPPEGQDSGIKSSGRFLKWHQRILGLCFSVFAMELGLFLIVFPWFGSWDLNWVPLQSPGLRALWMSFYFRGALSGLGLVNLYIGLAELFKQLRSLFQ